jgi:hypothetical protein
MNVAWGEEVKDLRFSFYFGQTNENYLNKFIDLTEELLCGKLKFWPYHEIVSEGYSAGEPIITAWKSSEKSIRIIIVEDQSYKYTSNLIAFYSCPESEKQQLDDLLTRVASRFKKMIASSKQRTSDQHTVAWVKEHRFILTIFGFTTLGGGSIFLRLFPKNISPPYSFLDISMIALSKILFVLMLMAAVFFIFIFCFKVIRVILR